MSQEHPIVMILGWRSGSSSLTKELYEKGYPLTPPLDVRPMEGHQPEGHYENSEVQQINEALLDHFQMNVYTPGILPFVNADVVENWLGQHPEPVIAKDRVSPLPGRCGRLQRGGGSFSPGRIATRKHRLVQLFAGKRFPRTGRRRVLRCMISGHNWLVKDTRR